MSIEFQFVSGPPQAQHSLRTVKYFMKRCVRGPRNIFNENIRKQEFGLSKTSTSPSEHIPSKTIFYKNMCPRTAKNRTQFQSNFLTTKNSAGQHSYSILIVSCSSERIPSKTELSLSPCVHRVPIYKRPQPQAQHSPRTAKYFTEGVSKSSTSPSEHIPSKNELSLSPCVHRVPICKRPAAGAT